MKKTGLWRKTMWFFALILTLATVLHQRATGPTYPVKGKMTIGDEEIVYKLARSHAGSTDCLVEVKAIQPAISGKLVWKRYKTKEDWQTIPMQRKQDRLYASLPNQPPAGKLEYKVILSNPIEKTQENSNRSGNLEGRPLTGETSVIIRFRGDVPWYFLIPHIILMFSGMLLAIRATMEAMFSNQSTYSLTWFTTASMFIGGMILGPIVQYYAFGQFWTGFPLGTDLTDNKTAISMIAWIVALLAGRKQNKGRWWVMAAGIVTLIIYLIPHSLFGSELDYSKLSRQ